MAVGTYLCATCVRGHAKNPAPALIWNEHVYIFGLPVLVGRCEHHILSSKGMELLHKVGGHHHCIIEDKGLSYCGSPFVDSKTVFKCGIIKLYKNDREVCPFCSDSECGFCRPRKYLEAMHVALNTIWFKEGRRIEYTPPELWVPNNEFYYIFCK
jgi:hypothetical protein